MDQHREIPVYSISNAARVLGISVHTLRMYEREGLIVPYKKLSNQRAYSKADIERLRCIRAAIVEKKIGIAGIKMIFSLIPCWELKPCSAADQQKCPAFNEHTKPCWTYKHAGTTCEAEECRDCSVYRDYSDCSTIKQAIISTTRNVCLPSHAENF